MNERWQTKVHKNIWPKEQSVKKTGYCLIRNPITYKSQHVCRQDSYIKIIKVVK